MGRRSRGRAAALAVAAAALLAGAGILLIEGAPPWSTDRRLDDPEILESSGLAASLLHPGVVWTHNDSKNEPELFAVAPDGTTAAKVRLEGIEDYDWEAIQASRDAEGTSQLWVGDVGDYKHIRPSVQVLRLEEPTDLTDQSVAWTSFDLVYPDGARDAEAILVEPDTQRLLVIAKDGSGIFAAPQPLTAGTNTLQRIADAPDRVTDATMAPDGTIVLVGYIHGWVAPSIEGPWTRFPIPPRQQGESATWTADGSTLLVGSEGVETRIWAVQRSVIGHSIWWWVAIVVAFIGGLLLAARPRPYQPE